MKNSARLIGFAMILASILVLGCDSAFKTDVKFYNDSDYDVEFRLLKADSGKTYSLKARESTSLSIYEKPQLEITNGVPAFAFCDVDFVEIVNQPKARIAIENKYGQEVTVKAKKNGIDVGGVTIPKDEAKDGVELCLPYIRACQIPRLDRKMNLKFPDIKLEFYDEDGKRLDDCKMQERSDGLHVLFRQ